MRARRVRRLVAVVAFAALAAGCAPRTTVILLPEPESEDSPLCRAQWILAPSRANLAGHRFAVFHPPSGRLLGSGTVSNEDRARGISCLAERRMIETIDRGTPLTPFLKVGDTVAIEMRDAAGRDLFGRIEQTTVAP